jgi:DNA-directed RNA polymerase specialized sigma24 family protein
MAIRYRYLEGLPLDTVAHRMKRTSGAVLMLCHRGLKMLRMDLRSFSRYG